MKHKIFTSLALYLMPMVLLAQLTLTIEIDGLRNNRGQIHLELKNENEEQLAVFTKNIANNKCTIVIENIKPGKYAFSFFHDENKNNELDTNWLGMPKEGFGFSNDPISKFGPPPFDKTLFELYESKVIHCKPKYL